MGTLPLVMRTKLAAALVAAQIAALLAPAPAVAATTFPPSEWVVGADKRIVMITFDGSTRSKAFLNVLETLDRKNAKASFFLPGSWVDHHEDKARRARVQGHTLGNRGYGDGAFTSMSDDELRRSISRA